MFAIESGIMANVSASCEKIQKPGLRVWLLVAMLSAGLASGGFGAEKPGAKPLARSNASSHAKPDSSVAAVEESRSRIRCR